MKQITKISKGILTDTVEQLLLEKNIQVATRKMTMPEKGHFLTKLRIAIHHFVYPVNIQTPDSFTAFPLKLFALFGRHFLFLQSCYLLDPNHKPLQIVICCLQIFWLF